MGRFLINKLDVKLWWNAGRWRNLNLFLHSLPVSLNLVCCETKKNGEENLDKGYLTLPHELKMNSLSTIFRNNNCLHKNLDDVFMGIWYWLETFVLLSLQAISLHLFQLHVIVLIFICHVIIIRIER